MRGAAPGRAAAREGAGAAEGRAADPGPPPSLRREPAGACVPRARLTRAISGPVLEDTAVRRALLRKLASPFGLRRLRVAAGAGR